MGQGAVGGFGAGQMDGWGRATWPLVAFTAEGDSVIYGFLWKSYKFRREEIVEFARCRKGFRIVHKRDDVPKLMMFYTWGGCEKMLQQLQALGYKVGGSGPR